MTFVSRVVAGVAAVCAFLNTYSVAATAAAGPCAAPEFRAVDFWVGEWRVEDAQGKLAGMNSIRSEENGCVLVERWRSATGRTGMSMTYYDPAMKSWHQLWIGLDILLKMQGGLVDGALVLQGPLQYLASGKTTLLRGTWSQLSDGRVRQRFVESEDGGTTWKEWFDGYYSASKPE